MVLESDKYTYRVLWSEEDEEFIGLCAEFPSLSWLASTSEKALKGIRSIVKDCVSTSFLCLITTLISRVSINKV